MTYRAHRTRLAGLLCVIGVASPAFGEASEFDFKDPKGVNCIAFTLDSLLEPFSGVASGVSGKVKFDPANPQATAGKISVETKSLHLDNKGMKDTLLGPDWLDAQKNPKIEFTVKKVTEAKKTAEDVYDLTVVGDMTCKGVTKELTVPVKLSYLPGKLSERSGKLSGDLLVLRSNFTMKRKDFDIKADMDGKVVAEDIEVRVSIAGHHAKK
jgi:polyisoprenoid-binding protein YceI